MQRPDDTETQNAYYERSAILALAGDVAGRRILDAGCGAGPLSAELRDRGAIVTGFDESAGTLELARQRLGDQADLRVTISRPSAAGFLIAAISEPQPVPEARELDPDGFSMLSTNPSFLFFVLHSD